MSKDKEIEDIKSKINALKVKAKKYIETEEDQRRLDYVLKDILKMEIASTKK